jgi:hypothetical protein
MSCRLNGDIAVAIIDQLDTKIAGHQRDLAVLARTCRLFSEPALNKLWEDPPAWHLAQRMPLDRWAIQERHNGRYGWDMLVRPLAIAGPMFGLDLFYIFRLFHWGKYTLQLRQRTDSPSTQSASELCV